jgi:hypothetical protein
VQGREALGREARRGGVAVRMMGRVPRTSDVRMRTHGTEWEVLNIFGSAEVLHTFRTLKAGPGLITAAQTRDFFVEGEARIELTQQCNIYSYYASEAGKFNKNYLIIMTISILYLRSHHHMRAATASLSSTT